MFLAPNLTSPLLSSLSTIIWNINITNDWPNSIHRRPTLSKISPQYSIILLEKITHFVLRKAQKNYEVASKRIKQNSPPQYFKNCHIMQTGIPFTHKIQNYCLEKELVEPQNFHPQGYLKLCVSLPFTTGEHLWHLPDMCHCRGVPIV
ncbi:hypothetical protein VP01_2087g7 [Puccinia sorghi]|uniref:Uncharacterized protein n=1 Tax=Puccinia sorghi TaxID=27349 RepID=A0A0L6VAF8_9BASI|nr:hypothetical protein VP01_2087g7 [Puccinia sorghi]